MMRIDPTHACRRPRKSAAERREQRHRAEARTIGKILSGYHLLSNHRGSRPTKLFAALCQVLSSAGGTSNETFQAASDAHTTPYFDWDTLERDFDNLGSVRREMQETVPLATNSLEVGESSKPDPDVILNIESLINRVQIELDQTAILKNSLEKEAAVVQTDIQNAHGRIREMMNLRAIRPDALLQNDVDTLYDETIARSEHMNNLKARLNYLEARFRKLSRVFHSSRDLMASAFDTSPDVCRHVFDELLAEFENQVLRVALHGK